MKLKNYIRIFRYFFILVIFLLLFSFFKNKYVKITRKNDDIKNKDKIVKNIINSIKEKKNSNNFIRIFHKKKIRII